MFQFTTFLFVFALLFRLVAPAAAQETAFDSLAAAIRAMPADSQRSLQMADLAVTLARKSPAVAQTLAEEALAWAEDLECHTAEARATYALGVADFRAGNMADALENYSTALRICNQYRLWQPKTDILRGLGNIGLDQGDLEMAESYFNQSVALTRELGDSLNMAKSINNLGSIAAQRGNRPLAIAHFTHAANIFAAEKEAVMLVTSYANISGQYAKLKNYEQAIAYCDKAIEVNLQINDKRSLCSIYERMQMIYRDQQLYGDAKRYGEQCVVLAREVDNGVFRCNILRSYASTLMQMREYQTALPYIEEALNIYKRIGNIKMQAYTTYDLAWMFFHTSDLSRAQMYVNEALNIARMEDIVPLMASCEQLMGEIHLQQGNVSEAITRLEEAKRLISTHTLPPADYAEVYRLLADLYTRNNQPDKAAVVQAAWEAMQEAVE